jgi:hypothetical protein
MTGNSSDAVAWVESSSLPKAAKTATLKFIHRFPTLEFYQDDEPVLKKVEKSNKVKLPEWFWQVRQTLGFVMPKQHIWAQFDEFNDWSPRSDLLGELWYSIYLKGYPNEEEQNFLAGMAELHLFPIGGTDRPGEGTLAINISDPSDQVIYEYNLEDLWDNATEGNSPADSVYQVFDSYSQMLSHIVAIKVQNKKTTEIIKAA